MVRKLLLFILFTLLAPALHAAVETTTLAGKIVLPGGAVATGGKVRATISDTCATDDGGTEQLVRGRTQGTIAANGDVTLVLVPNDVCTPTGTFYTVKISVTGPERASWTEKWSITTSPDPVDIGDITRLTFAPGLTVGSYILYIATEPTGACTTADAPTYAEDTDKICECIASAWVCSSIAGHTDGADCAAGEIPIGVDADGAVEGCYQPVKTDIDGFVVDDTDMQNELFGIFGCDGTEDGCGHRSIRPSTTGRNRDYQSRKPILVFRLDDGASSQMEVAWELMKARDLPGSFGINTGLFDGDNSYCDAFDPVDCTGSGTPVACCTSAGVGATCLALGDGILSAIPGADRPEHRFSAAEAIVLAKEGADLISHGESHTSPTEEYTLLTSDLNAVNSWFDTNLGFIPRTYIVPGGGSDRVTAHALSGWYDYVSSTTGGFISEDGLHYSDGAGWRFMGSAIFPGGIQTDSSGTNMCNFVEDAVLGNNNTMLVIGIHCISDASHGHDDDDNSWPEDDFTTFLDCVQGWRDEGKLDVLPMMEAVEKMNGHKPAWNKFSNHGWGEPNASTTTASTWSMATNGASGDPNIQFEANTDTHIVGRQLLYLSKTATSQVFHQRIGNLIVGKTYVLAVDVEFVTTNASELERRVHWRVQPGTGGGDSTEYIRGAVCSGTNQANERVNCILEFVAPDTYATIGFWAQGSAPAEDEMHWIFRYPRLYEMESVGGKDSQSWEADRPGLITFRLEGSFTHVQNGNKDDDLLIQGIEASFDLAGRHGSKFLITEVTFDISSTSITAYDWSLNGENDYTGVVYCSQTGNTGPVDTDRTACPYEDNESNDRYNLTNGAGGAGGELHLRFTETSNTAPGSVTYVIQGIVIQ